MKRTIALAALVAVTLTTHSQAQPDIAASRAEATAEIETMFARAKAHILNAPKETVATVLPLTTAFARCHIFYEMTSSLLGTHGKPDQAAESEFMHGLANGAETAMWGSLLNAGADPNKIVDLARGLVDSESMTVAERLTTILQTYAKRRRDLEVVRPRNPATAINLSGTDRRCATG